jgi:trehalose/maltose hydrolase-like predicted phosphorylase
MTQAARTRVLRGDEPLDVPRRTSQDGGGVEQRLLVEGRQGEAVHVEKVVAVYTSRDFAISEPTIAACTAIRRAGTFDELLETHRRAWSRLWHRADIEIGGADDWAQRVLRLHIFHLLQTTSFNSIDLDVGVPARGLHGEAYRGHIFWDELFIFPLLNLRMPELTRSLLMYRHRRLPQARRLASEQGLSGAMFPWQSGSDGREESQTIHLNPKSGRWIPDDTHRQRHVNAAIAYNVWQYYEATHDAEFLSFHGVEVLLEIARFWASLAEFNAMRGRYEIHHVVGPDEFHTAYPDTDSHGLNNNAYTNVMAAWALCCARHALDLLPEDRAAELIQDLEIRDEDLRRWDEISRTMFVPFHDGVISQFEGYEDLEEFAWEDYHKKHGDIQRLDRILEAEGDTANRYKASKQADTLMLFYLFSSEELREIFERLDYEFDPEIIPRTIDYYLHRTSHGSTLSRVVHSWVLSRSDRERAWELFRHALASDISDIQGGTTSEGIHLGAMAGAVDLVQRCYTGFELREDALWLNPCLPDDIPEIRLRLRYRGHWLRLHITHEKLAVTFEHGGSGAARVGFRDQVHIFAQGQERVFDL